MSRVTNGLKCDNCGRTVDYTSPEIETWLPDDRKDVCCFDCEVEYELFNSLDDAPYFN